MSLRNCAFWTRALLVECNSRRVHSQKKQSGQPPPNAIQMSARLNFILESLTLAQIQSALGTLAPARSLPSRTRQDAVDSVTSCGRTISEIEAALLNAEIELPPKHCILARRAGSIDDWILRLEDLRPDLIREYQTHDFLLSLSNVAVRKTDIVITFEHVVENQAWVLVDETTKTLETRRYRHAVFVRFSRESDRCTIEFDGITIKRGRRPEGVSEYEALVLTVVNIAEQCIGIRIERLPIQRALKILEQGDGSLMTVIHSDIKASSGHLALSSGSNSSSVTDFMEKFLSSESDGVDESFAKELRQVVRSAIRDASARTKVCWWREAGFVTRFHFWESFTEFFFVWSGSNRSRFVVDAVLDKIFTLAVSGQTEGAEDVWEFIGAVSEGTRVELSDVTGGEFGVTVDAAKSLLARAVSLGLFKLEFMLDVGPAAPLADYQNNWVDDPAILNRKFDSLESDEPIDGSNPKNIRVSFVRTKRADTESQDES